MKNFQNYKKTIEFQFDSFCKAVLRNQARNIYKEKRKMLDKLVPFDSINDRNLSSTIQIDEYEFEYKNFYFHNYKILVKDSLIAEAIDSLSNTKKEVILLSFFIGLKEKEISKLMSLKQSTISYHKKTALEELKKIMEDDKK